MNIDDRKRIETETATKFVQVSDEFLKQLSSAFSKPVRVKVTSEHDDVLELICESVDEPLPRELRERLAKLVNRSADTPLETIVDTVEYMREQYYRICEGLQTCSQKYKLGLGGEHVDVLVIEEVDRLRKENDELRSALESAESRAQVAKGEMNRLRGMISDHKNWGRQL